MKKGHQTGTASSLAYQPTLSESVEKSQDDKKGKRWMELTKVVTYYIAKDGLPVYTVEKQGFKKYWRHLTKDTTLPSQKYFSQRSLPRLYASLKEKVKQELSAASFFSAITDLWSSICLKPFISYTIHFINSNWKLCSRCLQTQYIPKDHTGDNISEPLKSTLHS